MSGQDFFIVSEVNARLVIGLLEPLIDDASIASGLRTYYRRILADARSITADAPPERLVVSLCKHSGLLFEYVWGGRGKRPELCEAVRQLTQRANGMAKRDENPAISQNTYAALAACRAEGITNISTIRTRVWAGIEEAQRAARQARRIKPVPERIFVDARETRSGVIDHLRTLGAVIEQEQMDTGDYRYQDGNISWVVERKQVNELVLALRSGDLTEQLLRLVNAGDADHIFLIVEGDLRQRRVALSDNSLFGYLATLMLAYDIKLWESDGPYDTALFLVSLARNAAKEDHTMRLRSSKPQAPRLQHLFLLEGLPGVGREMAGRLLDHFGTSGAVFGATVDQLCAVEGIGLGRAQRIYEALH